ncbi:uncharacterized protein LOC5513113 isoform X1 [Nematostella vectensis]|uniref:uncharacterized protein LOC5513113 isoform X1 n=2 Tax=Nematostella vectensis TaxID=45351 RepID=UPI00207794C7|nr:uncharacterized protein LOC5513113 isoform X1 [Nematostella vectensis]XP_032238450.2 uncharacterized protein LOC5513113 isoform X1 [Nematostella vectensis]XP_032238451.2 uncharacterized protein LOC5513113 isoform X1 [Nematostella vectensis]
MRVSVVLLVCVSGVILAQAAHSSKKASKKDDIFSPDELSELHRIFKHNSDQTEDEIKAAFPVMGAFKEHELLSSDDLKDKSEFTQNSDDIENAVQSALAKLHKKKAEYEEAIGAKSENEKSESSSGDSESPPPKPHVSAKELIDEVVKQEMSKHKKKNNDGDSEETGTARSGEEKKIHHKLAEISYLEEKLFHLIRDVKKYLLKKKTELPEHHAADAIEDDDNIDNILLSKKKRSEIPHIGLLEKFRKDPSLVDKYMDTILNEEDSATEQGDQRDLLGKKDMESALLKQACPGDLDSVPISRLDRESEDMEAMATDRGIAREALVESPFSVLDVQQTTGKKFRHNLN